MTLFIARKSKHTRYFGSFSGLASNGFFFMSTIGCIHVGSPSEIILATVQRVLFHAYAAGNDIVVAASDERLVVKLYHIRHLSHLVGL